jgi:hypothetical protein
VTNAIDARADLVQKPPGTGSGFPVTKTICENRAEFDGPFAEGFVEEWRSHGRPFMTMLTWMPYWCSTSWSSRSLSGKRWYSQTVCWMMVMGKRWL